MKWTLLALNFTIILVLSYVAIRAITIQNQISGAPPNGASESEVPDLDPLNWFSNWKRPDGSPRVGLQVGHLENANLPEELNNLIGNTGASGGGKTEVEINAAIAEETKKLLESRGIVVDILPATIPPSYVADAFVSIHADGNLNKNVNGYKVSGPWRDWSNKSTKLSDALDQTYATTTGLTKDPEISRNMRGYYAFSWWRYQHSIHPMTPGVIIETGFLSSPTDQRILINNPTLAAQGIASGIIKFLKSEKIIF